MTREEALECVCFRKNRESLIHCLVSSLDRISTQKMSKMCLWDYSKVQIQTSKSKSKRRRSKSKRRRSKSKRRSTVPSLTFHEFVLDMIPGMLDPSGTVRWKWLATLLSISYSFFTVDFCWMCLTKEKHKIGKNVSDFDLNILFDRICCGLTLLGKKSRSLQWWSNWLLVRIRFLGWHCSGGQVVFAISKTVFNKINSDQTNEESAERGIVNVEERARLMLGEAEFDLGDALLEPGWLEPNYSRWPTTDCVFKFDLSMYCRSSNRLQANSCFNRIFQ